MSTEKAAVAAEQLAQETDRIRKDLGVVKYLTLVTVPGDTEGTESLGISTNLTHSQMVGLVLATLNSGLDPAQQNPAVQLALQTLRQAEQIRVAVAEQQLQTMQ